MTGAWECSLSACTTGLTMVCNGAREPRTSVLRLSEVSILTCSQSPRFRRRARKRRVLPMGGRTVFPEACSFPCCAGSLLDIGDQHLIAAAAFGARFDLDEVCFFHPPSSTLHPPFLLQLRSSHQ